MISNFGKSDNRWRAFLERIRKSAMLYGALGTAMRVGANLLLVPLVLIYFSPGEQAIWWLFLALGGFANLADFGFGAAITRVYSFLWAGAEDFATEGLPPPSAQRQPNLPRIRQLNRAVRHLYLCLSLFATLVLAVVGTFLLLRPVREAGQPPDIWLAWMMYLAVIGYSLCTSHWMLAAQGINRVREVQAAILFGVAGYLIIGVVLLVSGGGLFSMVAAVGVRGIITRLLCRRAYRTAVAGEQGDSPFDPGIVRRLWPNAWKFGVMSLGGYLVGNANIFICSHLLGVATTASYGLTAQVGAFLVSLSALWLAVKWPQITILRAQGQTDGTSKLFARRLAFCLFTYVVLAGLVICFGNTVLGWRGVNKTQMLMTTQLCLYFFYLGQQMVHVQFAQLTFTENVVPFVRLSNVVGLAVPAASVWLTHVFGLWGMLLAPWLVESASSTWIVIRRGFRGQPLTPLQFVKAAFGGDV